MLLQLAALSNSPVLDFYCNYLEIHFTNLNLVFMDEPGGVSGGPCKFSGI